jgi:hypothetical protein
VKIATIAETCEVLRISRWTLGRLIRANEIKAVKQNPAVRNSPVDVDADSVDDYIRRHTVPAHNPTEDPLMSEDKTRRLLTLEEVADETGFPLKTLQLGCREKRIRHVRFGKKPQMSREHIDELVEKYTVTPTDEADDDRAEDRARVARMAAAAT